MLNLKNLSPENFIKYIQNKDLYFFGAGEIAENAVDIYCENKSICALVDNNSKLWGTSKKLHNQFVDVISVEVFKKIVSEGKKDIVLLITPTFHAADIIGQLNAINELDGLECFLHVIMRNTKSEDSNFEFTKGVQLIPKKIHYFWIGGNSLPKQFQEYVDGWKKINPEYEVIRWDESNYDFSKIAYMKEAYDNKAWAFATDYARLDIIYQHGGIYFDTDVEVVKSLDCMLNDNAFFGFGCGDRINIGVGFGAVPKHPIIKEMMTIYNDHHFVNSDGSFNKSACYYYQHPIMKKYGFKVNNQYQKINNIALYPAEVMSPNGTGNMGDFYSDKTLSIHHNSNLWVTDEQKKSIMKMIKKANEQI